MSLRIKALIPAREQKPPSRHFSSKSYRTGILPYKRRSRANGHARLNQVVWINSLKSDFLQIDAKLASAIKKHAKGHIEAELLTDRVEMQVRTSFLVSLRRSFCLFERIDELTNVTLDE